MKANNWLLLAGVGIVGYILYKKFGVPIGAAIDSATQSVANTYVDWTSPPLSVPQGSVVFQNGSYIPTSSLADPSFNRRWSGNSLLIDYQGHTYQLSSHDTNGNYPATLVS